MATQTTRPACRDCGQPVTCHPTGHHCPNCGTHDDTACETFPEPQPGEEFLYAETIALPADVFDPLLAHQRRRNAFRWAIDADGPMALAVRELAAAHATDSRRLTPMAAYRLARNLASITGCDTDQVDDRPYWAVLDLMSPGQRDACEATDKAEQAAAMAEYRAWRAAQLEAQGTP